MATKKQSPSEVLAAIRARENADRVTVGALSEFAADVRGYSTGNVALDYLTGVGGYPVGRIVEQFGEYSSGKTTSALQALAKEQQRIIEAGTDEYVMFLDYERSIDPKYIKALGIDGAHPSLVHVHPKSFEHGANIFRELMETGAVRIAVFDSVAAMVTEKEMNAETGAATVADRAKAMHQFLRQITAPCEEYGTTPIFLNHTMEKVDTSVMGQRLAARGIKRMTQPGGSALPFYASLRIEFKKTEKVKTKEHDALTNVDDDLISGQNVTATVVKNKAGVAFGKANLRVRFGRGFSQPYSVLALMRSYKMIQVKGAWYTFPADVSWNGESVQYQGEDAALTAIEENPSWLAKLVETVTKRLAAEGVPDRVDGSVYKSDGTVNEEVVNTDTGEIVWETAVDLGSSNGGNDE